MTYQFCLNSQREIILHTSYNFNDNPFRIGDIINFKKGGRSVKLITYALKRSNNNLEFEVSRNGKPHIYDDNQHLLVWFCEYVS